MTDTEHAQRFGRARDARSGLREIALRLLQRDARRGFVLEQIRGHRGCFFGELEILLALEILANRRRGVAAGDRAERLALPDAVADLDVKVDDLAGDRRQDAREAIFVELHASGDGERGRRLAIGDGTDDD